MLKKFQRLLKEFGFMLYSMFLIFGSIVCIVLATIAVFAGNWLLFSIFVATTASLLFCLAQIIY